MIRILYSPERERAEVYFSGPSYQDAYAVSKDNFLQFDGSTKCWHGSVRKIASIAVQYERIDPACTKSYDYKSFYEQMQKECVPELKRIRRIYDTKHERVKPYLGKGQYVNFQRESVEKGITQNRLAYYLTMGLGKTYIQIMVMNHLFADASVDRVFIIVPTEAVYNWKYELMRFNTFDLKDEEIYIVSRWNRTPFEDLSKRVIICPFRSVLTICDDEYKLQYGRASTKYRKDVLSAHFQQWGMNRMLVVDECFPKGTKVKTDQGELTIDYIVNNKVECNVLSYNFCSKTFEWKPIVRFMKKSYTGKMYTLFYGRGKLDCTSNHNLWSEQDGKYKKAEDFSVGESLSFLQSDVLNKKKRAKVLLSWVQLSGQENRTSRKNMRRMSKYFFRKKQKLQKEILFNSLLCEMEDATRQRAKESLLRSFQGKGQPLYEGTPFFSQRETNQGSFFTKNEKEKPLYLCRSSEKVEGNEKTERNFTCMERGTRREWKINATSGYSKRGIRGGVVSGISYSCTGKSISRKEDAHSLQNRCRVLGEEDSYRNRWEQPQKSKSKREGYEENFIPPECRLEGLPILESRSATRTNEVFVYNLEIADNHNYFAERILVSNCHNLKNLQARQTELVMRHVHNFEYRYLLSGTPAPNKFEELYAQMKILDKTLVSENYYDFLHEIANIGNRFSKVAVNYYYQDKVRAYEERFSDVTIRLKSEDAIDLPDLYIQKIHAQMSPKHEQIYQEFVNYIVTVMTERDGEIVPSTLQNQFPYIAQAVDNPCLLKGKIDKVTNPAFAKLVDSFKFEEHGKLDELSALLEKYITEEGRKVILFDYHPLTIDQLAKHYKKYNPLTIHGQNECDDQAVYRAEVMEQFKKDQDYPLLIASSIVLSTAVNLQEASRVIYFSRDWSLVHYTQSMKRAHRIGQTKNVIVNPLVFLDSLDMYLDKRLEGKKLLDENIFSKDRITDAVWASIFKGKDSIWQA